MPTNPTITTKPDLQGKPTWVSAGDWYDAVEHVCARCDHDFDAMLHVLSGDGELDWWAVKLAQAMSGTDQHALESFQIELRKHLADAARKTVATWDSADWQQYYEDSGREDPNAWPSDETLGIPVNGWRNQ